MNNVIIDCDPGYDDAIAIMLAAKATQVKAITTVAGNVSLENTSANALSLAALLDLDIEIHSGCSKPLVGPGEFAADIHGQSGLGGVTLPDHDLKLDSANAVEFLLDSADQSTWVIATGPLTNIATVLMSNPAWLKQIAGLSLMGGSSIGGNITPAAEFNFYFDPEAAAIVLDSPGVIRMCGLNLTHQIQVTREQVQDWFEQGNQSPLSQSAKQILEGLITNVHKVTGSSEAALHDPCAILAVSHSHLFSFTSRDVEVELNGAHTRGMSVVDTRSRVSECASGVEFAEVLDVLQAKQVVADLVFGVRSRR